MVWANFLHIYQPTDQQKDILEAVVAQSYRPLISGIKKNKKARLTLNVNGVLLELFDKFGFFDLIDDLRFLGREGRLEFSGSAKYHAFLPFLEEKEIVRQIEANNETNKYFLKEAYNPSGFFSPEMAYVPKLAGIIESAGFNWIILDEIACGGAVGLVDYEKIYRIKGTNLKVFFRERRLSNLIMSAIVRSAETLEQALKSDLKSERYIITGMDGETFGHHRPGLEKTILDIFASPKFRLVKISELLDLYKNETEIKPVKSTWASSKQDIDGGNQFLSWSDPDNPIHKWQRSFTDLALSEVYSLDNKSADFSKIRKAMDAGLASDHFWWASAKPWWSVEMIELGAHRLLEIVRSVSNVSKETLDKASDYYEKIISTAFEWQRTGKIRKMMQERHLIYKIPFKDRTWGLGGVGGATYRAFLDMLGKLEKKAALRGEYEKAILWRDAIWRIEHKTDIYEAINAIDLLRKEIPNEEVEKTIKKYRAEYLRIRGGQPEDRG